MRGEAGEGLANVISIHDFMTISTQLYCTLELWAVRAPTQRFVHIGTTTSVYHKVMNKINQF